MRKRRPRKSAEELRLTGSKLAKEASRREQVQLTPMERPYLTDYIIAAIDDIGRHRMQDKDLCEVAQISAPTLSSFLSGRRNASGETLDRLFNVLGLRVTWKDGRLISIPKSS